MSARKYLKSKDNFQSISLCSLALVDIFASIADEREEFFRQLDNVEIKNILNDIEIKI